MKSMKDMKTIDLSKVTVKNIDGTDIIIDVAKELAQVIFANTQSIEEHSFAIEMYKHPVIDLTEGNRDIITKYVDKFFRAYVKIAIQKLITN